MLERSLRLQCHQESFRGIGESIKIANATHAGWFRAPHAKSKPHASQWYSYTGSDQHIMLARFWISECNDQHQTCRVGGATCRTPTRIIQIEDANQIRFHVTTSEAQVIQYFDLSHC